MTKVAQAAKAALDNFCAESLDNVATACRVAACAGDLNAVEGLAMHSLFHGLAQRIDDRAVESSEVNTLASQWSPVLELLSKAGGGGPSIPGLNEAIAERHHLIC